MSESEKLREKGNNLYTTDNEDLSFGARISIIDEAKHFYIQALTKATNKSEEASAAKNAAAASRRLADLYKDYEQSTTDQIETIKNHTKSAIRLFARASTCSGGKDWNWKRKLDTSMKNCLEDALEWLQPFPVRFRLVLTEEFISLLPSCDTKAEAYIQYAESLLNLAINSISSKDYKEAYRFLKECNFPLEEAKSMGRQDQTKEEDILKYLCITEAMEEMSKAENMLTDLLMEQENLNMDMVWNTIDHFRKSVNFTQGRDIQLEAKLMARLGHIYSKVLKMKEKAKDCFKASYELALSIEEPRRFTDEDWYTECQTFLQEYQREKQEELDKKDEQANKQIKEELKEDIKKLQEHQGDTVKTFLEFVYKTWPPKKDSHKLNGDQEEKLMLLNALRHYHPDKQDKDQHGQKWVLLCSEISKVITARYEKFKGF